MKLIIDIPTEFEIDYNGDKFKDFFSRVLCDIEKVFYADITKRKPQKCF